MSSSLEQASSEERMLAALAQLGILLPAFGFMVPLFIWLNNRDWSSCVQFHALQALVWHLVSSSMLFLYFVLFFGVGFGALAAPYEGLGLPARLITLRCFILLVGTGGYAALAMFGIRSSRAILSGYKPSYPVIGPWLSRYL